MRVVIAVTIAALLAVSVPATASSGARRTVCAAERMLCGGAAVSMVMRYWGPRKSTRKTLRRWSTSPREASPWVPGARREEREGVHIRLRALPPMCRGTSARGGVIALVEDHRPPSLCCHRGADGDRVAFMIPRSIRFARCMRRTSIGAGGNGTHDAARASRRRRDGVAGARPRSAAATACGARRRCFGQRYADAAHLAAWLSTRTRDDNESWQLLAASRYLQGDAGGRDAWNRRDEPRVDLARVDGLSRTSFDVIAGMIDLPARTLLTREGLDRAARRVAAVPAVQLSRVDYSPRENGSATVNVAVVERPLLPASRSEIAAAAIYAATRREAQINVSSPSGNGELWSASARWWTGRPRVEVALAVPNLARWKGLWRIAADGSARLTGSRAPPSKANAGMPRSASATGRRAACAGNSVRRSIGGTTARRSCRFLVRSNGDSRGITSPSI